MTTAQSYSKADEVFYSRLVAGSDISPKLAWRTHRARPFLVTERIADAANRLWIVPSLRREDRRYYVSLDTKECYYYGPAGDRHECLNRRYGSADGCVHYLAAERREREMFGGNAREFFRGVIWNPPEAAHA